MVIKQKEFGRSGGGQIEEFTRNVSERIKASRTVTGVPTKK
jgi:hypothetical protein